MNRRLLLLYLSVLLAGVATGQPSRHDRTAKALNKVLTYQPHRSVPLLLAHRGGPDSSETENSLATFRRTSSRLPAAILEMDVRMTADSVLVLLHDDDIARTTTGTGLLHQMNWQAVQQLFLRDLQGRLTQQHVARFDDVLRWASGRILLAIDAKPGVDLHKVMAAIAKADALHGVFIICYSTADALLIRRQYPDVWLALGFTSPDRLGELKEAGLGLRHLIALASPQPAAFYRQLHAVGIPCTVGTYGADNLDSQPVAQAAAGYRKLFTTGADIITTDRPVDVAPLFTRKQR